MQCHRNVGFDDFAAADAEAVYKTQTQKDVNLRPSFAVIRSAFIGLRIAIKPCINQRKLAKY